MAIELNKETGKVEIDLETYQLLVANLGDEVLSPKLLKEFLKRTYPESTSYNRLTDELGICVNDMVNSRTRPGWRLCKKVVSFFGTDEFMIKVPTFKELNPGDIDSEFIKHQAVREETQKDFKDQIVRLISRKTTTLNISTLPKLAHALNCDIGDLYVGKEDLTAKEGVELKKVKEISKLTGKTIFSTLLQQRKMSQKYVSLMMGIGQSTVSFWVNGTASPKSDTYFRLCVFLGTPIDYFSDWLNIEE
ncbi:helix-turn-helix protein [Serratia phage vB_SmaS-Totoro]|nr:helix-turn-helix protein [Serratia phage vB_SmaS-Totoro]